MASLKLYFVEVVSRYCELLRERNRRRMWLNILVLIYSCKVEIKFKL